MTSALVTSSVLSSTSDNFSTATNLANIDTLLVIQHLIVYRAEPRPCSSADDRGDGESVAVVRVSLNSLSRSPGFLDLI